MVVRKTTLVKKIVSIALVATMACQLMACGGGKQDKPSKETTSNIEQESTSSQSGGATTDKDDSSGSSDVNKETTSDDVTTKQEETSKQEETTTKQPDSGSSGNTGNTGNTGNSGNNSSQGTSVTDFGVITPSGKYTSVGTRVSVHDPSIEYDATSGQWYIFGSHTAFARTKNLINWTMFEKEGSSNAKYGAIFAKSGEYAARGGAGYDIKGNLWAPDVIYNKDMKKWCMYMSVNGSNFYSSIAMATADSIEGPYTYQGTVVWSGMTIPDDVAQTDYKKVTGTTDVSRYTSQGWWYYGTNAIDPCVLYDKDGQLWMVYGSWFGGLFMLKLDNKTGLRDYSYTYALDTNASDGVASDPYMGKRVSGGYGGTGEGPYIVWDKEAGYYYMYVSYCGLNGTDGFSGYQMRLFRSKNVDGPYVDAKGNYAVRTSGSNRYDQADKGIKIMGNYKFSSLATAEGTGSQNGYRSPGHNSAIVDNAGNRYLIYHTRFNTNSEWHQLRVHQQFLNEDGWLVTAPYEYLGSKISATGYKETDIVGSYELINHGNEITFDIVAPMLSTAVVNLNADHTITGDYTGTWSQKSGSYYATLKIDGVTYKGVFFKQYDESSSHKETMTFTVIGSNNIALWGSRTGDIAAPETGKQVAAYTFEDTANLGKDTVGTIGVATINGCTTYKDTSRGKVLAFDGSDDYVKLASKATEYDSYTIMMWFKTTDTSRWWQRVFDLGDNNSNYMFFTTKSNNGSEGYRFAQKYNGGNETLVDGGAADTSWNHVAVTVSGKSKTATLYINGQRVGSTTLSTVPKTFSGSANYLGKSQFDSDVNFLGYMDNVFIFDYALSASEIKTYMNK